MEHGGQRLTAERSEPPLPGEHGQRSTIYGQTGPGQIQVPDDTRPVWSLFEDLIETQRWVRKEAVKKKAVREANAETESLLARVATGSDREAKVDQMSAPRKVLCWSLSMTS